MSSYEMKGVYIPAVKRIQSQAYERGVRDAAEIVKRRLVDNDKEVELVKNVENDILSLLKKP